MLILYSQEFHKTKVPSSEKWEKGRLPAPAVTIPPSLPALKDGSVATADRLQRSLMVDYPGECSSWMPGIRQLIVRLSPPAESGSAPADTPADTPSSAPGDAPGQTPAVVPTDGGGS